MKMYDMGTMVVVFRVITPCLFSIWHIKCHFGVAEVFEGFYMYHFAYENIQEATMKIDNISTDLRFIS